MHQADFIHLMRSEEAAGDCWGIKLDGIPVWPLFRVAAYFAWRNKKGVSSPIADAGLKFDSEKIPDDFRLGSPAATGKRVLLISRDEGLNDRVDGRLFDKYLSATRILFENRYQISAVTYGQELDRFEDVTDISALLLSRSKAISANVPAAEVEELESYRQRFCRKSGLKIDLNDILNAYASYLVGKTFWSDVFETYSPDYVICTCFYIPLLVGACTAAKRKGIRFIDLQHGRVGGSHPVMSNWNFKKAPPGSLDLFPNEFWCWHDENTRRIRETWIGDTDLPRARTFGNPWQFLRAKEIVAVSYDGESSIRSDFIVMVALQPIDDAFPDHLIDALKEIVPDQVWVRPHPHQMGVLSEIETMLKSTGLRNCSLRVEYDLYSEFEQIDVLVTAFSTVASEASDFGIPVILVHPNARVAFDGEIDGIKVFYSESAKASATILKKIMNGIQTVPGNTAKSSRPRLSPKIYNCFQN